MPSCFRRPLKRYPLVSDVFIAETTVSAINIGGLPGVTVPAGQYASNRAPFGLIFVGRPWSEADLLGFAYDYEQATHHRSRPIYPRLAAMSSACASRVNGFRNTLLGAARVAIIRDPVAGTRATDDREGRGSAEQHE